MDSSNIGVAARSRGLQERLKLSACLLRADGSHDARIMIFIWLRTS